MGDPPTEDPGQGRAGKSAPARLASKLVV
jgi:hypothetical protein